MTVKRTFRNYEEDRLRAGWRIAAQVAGCFALGYILIGRIEMRDKVLILPTIPIYPTATRSPSPRPSSPAGWPWPITAMARASSPARPFTPTWASTPSSCARPTAAG